MNIQGTVRQEDYVAAQFLHIRPRKSLAILGLLLLILSVAGMVYGHSWIIAAALIYFVLYFLVFIPWAARRNYRIYKAMSKPVVVTVKEAGLHFKGESGEGLVAWDEITKWRHSKNLILLYPTHNIFHMIPRHFFAASTEFDDFVALLSSKCGAAR